MYKNYKELNDILEYFITNIDEDVVILTDHKHFRTFDDKEKGVDLGLGVNTYKGYPVILRNDMPLNNDFVIMTRKDYIRNTNNEGE